VFLMRFDMRVPGLAPAEVARCYRAAVEMARWADERGGCAAIAVSEHHATTDGYLPSPLVLASAIAAVTERTPIMVGAAILPLYDPVRLAEEMIVLDHLSQGRVIHTLAVGYRREEYDQFGVDFTRRGAIAESKLATLLELLREASGSGADAAPRIAPPPFTAGGPMLTWGGGSVAAAERAGRHGIGFIAQSGDPALGDAYRAAAAAAGHEPGLCLLPDPASPSSVFVAADLDQGWSEVGPALLHDATEYNRWNVAAGQADTTVSLSSGTTVDELRAANGSHRVVTVDQAVDLIRQFGPLGLQPLCGGLDPDIAWPYLRRVADEVLPALT
jgi:alkanesulfonate monooxygenase SsuD/methylene tetrahydromethanopterin reductase-like flavin-dependent oxidoreductase (luciferase family)